MAIILNYRRVFFDGDPTPVPQEDWQSINFNYHERLRNSEGFEKDLGIIRTAPYDVFVGSYELKGRGEFREALIFESGSDVMDLAIMLQEAIHDIRGQK